MPDKLRNILLGDAAEPEEYHVTRSHHCLVKKTRDKDDGGKWICGRALDGQGCLSKMNSVRDSKWEVGWKCSKGNQCMDENKTSRLFVICLKCMRMDHLVENLPNMLVFNYSYIMKQIDDCKCPSHQSNYVNSRQHRRPVLFQVQTSLRRHPVCEARL